MHTIYPQKLVAGDEVRIVSPANSMGIISPEVRSIATSRLHEMGLKVSSSRHSEEMDEFHSSSIKSRVDDLHEAFRDPAVKAILTTLGGYNAIQLLRYLDFDLIRKNPKFFCGYSDVSTLQNAIFAKTGLVAYSGPHFSTFGCLKGIEYTVEHFKKCAFESTAIFVVPAITWSDDEWYLNQEDRVFENNPGFNIIHPGRASGTILGGNINSLNILQGTAYMPSLQDSIVFLEDDYLTTPEIFDRCLQSLLLQKAAPGIQGIVLGRFQKASKMSFDLLKKIIDTKKELEDVPVVAGVDFGHTLPMITFPIGGFVELELSRTASSIRITRHDKLLQHKES